MKRFTQEEIDIFKKLNFIEDHPDEVDPDYTQYWRYLPSHPLLKELHIIVDAKLIEIWCREHHLGVTKGDVLLEVRKFSLKELYALVNYLT